MGNYNKAFTHVGIACGCHKVFGDSCCIQFGRDVYDKTTTPPPTIPRQVNISNGASCEALAGSSLQTPLSDVVPPTPTATTYSQMTVDLYHHFNALVSNPTAFAASTVNSSAAANTSVVGNYVTAGAKPGNTLTIVRERSWLKLQGQTDSVAAVLDISQILAVRDIT